MSSSEITKIDLFNGGGQYTLDDILVKCQVGSAAVKTPDAALL